jgi:hypothetical protein
VVAFEAALRGDLGPAALPGEGEDLGRIFGCLDALARALAAGLAAPPGREGWLAAAPHLARAAAQRTVLERPSFLPRAWWRSLWRLSRHLGRGGPASALWLLRGLWRAARAPVSPR